MRIFKTSSCTLNPMDLSLAPSDIKINILYFLDIPSIINRASLVNKEWNRLSKNNIIWMKHLREQFPNSFEEYVQENHHKPIASLNFYQFYVATACFWRRLIKEKKSNFETITPNKPNLLFTSQIVFSNSQVLMGASDGSIHLFDLGTYRSEKKLDGVHTESVKHLLTYGDKVISAHEKCIAIWDVASGALIKKLEGHTDCIKALQLRELTLSPHGGKAIYLASLAIQDPKIKIWDIENGTLVDEYEIKNATISCFDLVQETFAAGTNDGQVFILQNKETVATLKQHTKKITQIKIHKELVISSSSDKTIKIWQRITGVCIASLEGHKDEIDGFKLLDDQLVSFSCDKTICIWNDLKNSRKPKVLKEHKDFITNMEIYDRKIISVSYDHTMRIWDFQSGKLLKTIQIKSASDQFYPQSVKVRKHKIVVGLTDKVEIYS